MRYTATLVAENTSVKVCDIVKPRQLDTWFANACATGDFGTGTVTWGISFNGGTTILPLNQDGTATAASQTAAGCVNLRSGHQATNTNIASLYASIATATNPSITLTVFDNR